jgi:hypothetical protein
MTTTQVKEQVQIELATELGDHSVAKIEVKNNDANSDAYISNSIRMNVSAEPDSGVWIAISGHTYARAGWDEPFTTSVDYISHHFTEAEARALLEVLTNELRKLD